MSEVGSPHLPWDEPELRARIDSKWRREQLGLAGIGLVVVAFLAWVVLRDTGGAGYPSEWDARVAPLVSFVERTRELDFDHPVDIEFLDEKTFREQVEEGVTGDIDAAAREQAEQDLRFMRALGLAEGDVDLIDASGQLSAETIVAYYDPSSEHVVVRGERLDVSTRVTLVHELVHALQDQRFDLERLDEIDDSSAALAAGALAEGDATVVEDAYIAQLSESERHTYEETLDDFGDDVDLEGIPEALSLYQAVPYVLGPSLVDALIADGGRVNLDEAYVDLPTTEEHLLAPLTFLERERALDVESPSLRGDETELTRDSFGAFGLFLVLSERIDAHDALAAVDGWGGDAYVTYRDDTRDCVRAAFVGNDRPSGTLIFDALDAWAAEGPAGTAEIDRDGTTIVLDACDPGEDANVVTGDSGKAFALPVARASFLRAFLAEDAPLEAAWCSASLVVEHSTVEELNDESGDVFASPEFQARLIDDVATCFAP